jgi:ferritin-like metal-binding protein YciE
MKMETLNDVFVEQLKDLYSAESQLIKAMPKMAKMSSSPELIDCLEKHLAETENQRARLDEIAEALGEKLTGKTCKAMKGLIEEGKEVDEFDKGPLRDSLIVASAQRIEHYEISGYGTARAMAQALNKPEIVELLNATLQEEGDADKKLTTVVYDSVYPNAPADEEALERMAAEKNGAGSNGKRKTKSVKKKASTRR